MTNTLLYSKLIGVTLLSIGLFISAFKNKILLAISIIIIAIGFLILTNLS